MIGIKDQCFGVEIELTGITRAEAAEALAAYFETTPQRSYDNYDSWYVPHMNDAMPSYIDLDRGEAA